VFGPAGLAEVTVELGKVHQVRQGQHCRQV